MPEPADSSADASAAPAAVRLRRRLGLAALAAAATVAALLLARFSGQPLLNSTARAIGRMLKRLDTTVTVAVAVLVAAWLLVALLAACDRRPRKKT